MRSSDLARLAGVSIRTLRHYHQIGLLPEPQRSANGYRVYDASDLVRVLRTRRLVDLGVPLSRIDPTVDVEEELALLDERYASQIEELTRRREVIRGLRQPGTRADTPAFAQHYLHALSEREGVSSQAVDVERDAAVVLELFLDKGARTGLEGLDRSAVAELVDVGTALLGVTDDAVEDHLDRVARALAAAIQRLRPSPAKHDLAQAAGDSLERHVNTLLTEVQLDVVQRARQLLSP